MKAIVSQDLGQASLIRDHPLPKLQDDYILVQTIAVAINPIDWKYIDYQPSPGATQGHDFAGIVEDVGSAVTKTFKKGDRVCGFTHGGDRFNPDHGAFAEYIVVKGDVALRIPGHVSFEEAASVGVGLYTAGMSLYFSLQLAMPLASPSGAGEPILIYGGSTASGVLAIQFANMSGYTVITTCSPKNFALMKSLGATAFFDYKDPNCGGLIREHTEDKLRLTFDTVAMSSSAAICAEAMSTDGGRYLSLLPLDFPRSDIDASFVNVTLVFGEYFEYGGDRLPIPAVPAALEFGKKWAEAVDKLWAEKHFTAHHIKVGEKGLGGVLDGLQLMREDKVSATKLVYRVEETP